MTRLGTSCVICLLFAAPVLAGETAGQTRTETVVTAVTYLDRESGQDAWRYELSDVISGSESDAKYIIGLEVREDALSQKFARFGIVYPAAKRPLYDLIVSAEYFPGTDSNGEAWHIVFGSALLKTRFGALLGASYKGYLIPGENLGVASFQAGYAGGPLSLMTELFQSLDKSSTTVRGVTFKGEVTAGPLSATAGRTIGKTFVSYAQLASEMSFDTREDFAGMTFRWAGRYALSLQGSRTTQGGFHQNGVTTVVSIDVK